NVWLVPPDLPVKPQLDQDTGKPKNDEKTHEQEMQPDPLGFLSDTRLGAGLRPDKMDWLGLLGIAGLFIAFGHSILAMSGEETLAQVYREVQAPKLPNFRKAAFIVFIYSLVF